MVVRKVVLVTRTRYEKLVLLLSKLRSQHRTFEIRQKRIKRSKMTLFFFSNRYLSTTQAIHAHNSYNSLYIIYNYMYVYIAYAYIYIQHVSGAIIVASACTGCNSIRSCLRIRRFFNCNSLLFVVGGDFLQQQPDIDRSIYRVYLHICIPIYTVYLPISIYTMHYVCRSAADLSVQCSQRDSH